jgi:hypothetical protein
MKLSKSNLKFAFQLIDQMHYNLLDRVNTKVTCRRVRDQVINQVRDKVNDQVYQIFQQVRVDLRIQLRNQVNDQQKPQ